MVRRANIFHTLRHLKRLTDRAMASIDADYWTKCIEHMKKECRYYQLHDRVHSDTNNEVVTIQPAVIVEPAAVPMIISVSRNSIEKLIDK